jgi:DNA-directed RNA polymerase specialized sigma24 family protein
MRLPRAWKPRGVAAITLSKRFLHRRYVKSAASHPEDAADWLVGKVKSDDPEGRDDLHRLFSRGIRFYLTRRLGLLQLDARFQETFTILVNAIKTETLNEYKPLIRLVHDIVLKQAAAYRDQDLQNLDEPAAGSSNVILDASRHPAQTTTHLQDIDRMVTVLTAMSPRDREVLTRFYFHEQTQARICEEMQMGVTQFLLLKARAMAMFWETTPALVSPPPD